MKLGATRPRRLTPLLVAAALAAAALLLLFRASPHGLAYSRARAPPARRPPLVARGPGSPPSFAYWISGTAGEGRRVLRLLAAVYHPRNRYLLHLDAGASREERTALAAAVRDEAAWRGFGNVDVVGESYAVDRTGSSVLAAALHGAAVLLRIGADWDWFVTLSSWDYPLVTQDDLLYAFSSLPRDLNFIDHSSDLGWKEHDRFEKLIVDSSLYMNKNTEAFPATETRKMPEGFRIFTEPAMARRKIAMGSNAAAAAAYAKRIKTLQKKAWELHKLCDVPVALVCAPGAGDGAPLVWESGEGVIERYRAAALPPDARARHTHRSYLEAELGKERAKLARARNGAGVLPDWDAALNDMTVDEAREVLETIDAALRAADERMVALGLPADGQQVALAPDDDASHDAAAVPQQLGPEDAGFQMQMVPRHDGGLVGKFSCDDRFPMQPGYDLESMGGNYGVGAIDETQAPTGYGHNADCGWPDLTMWYADDGSCLPAGHCYPKFVNSTLPPEHYSAQVVAGGGYIDTLPLQYPMGMDENFTNLDNRYTAQWQAEEFQRSDTNSSMDENCTYLDSSYAGHWQAEEFQRSDTGTGQYQYQCSDPWTRSSSQVFHHRY